MSLFGCHDRDNLSRVFTIRGVSYRVCLGCGAELEYDLATMRLTGVVLAREPEHPDAVAEARNSARQRTDTFHNLATERNS